MPASVMEPGCWSVPRTHTRDSECRVDVPRGHAWQVPNGQGLAVVARTHCWKAKRLTMTLQRRMPAILPQADPICNARPTATCLVFARSLGSGDLESHPVSPAFLVFLFPPPPPTPTGIIVYSLARCCSACSESLGPGRELVDVHRGFVTDSIHLFVLFYANLIVLSTHLPQEMLKLLPLLAAFFALARLIYWGTSAMSSTFRGFGYGLTFFPIVGLLVANLCYMFVLGPDKMFATSASGSEGQEEASGPRQRFWG
ncbi:transmembrane protein 79-like [Carcharodon carcharias]|uniref:transmembrane protein 79-like n=1 Tax=Carcharodon carcharias TaxID=13397 RepID=UPI001B7F4736|nr:transmembrane protein 79-like [Carcharodon carcharias]